MRRLAAMGLSLLLISPFYFGFVIIGYMHGSDPVHMIEKGKIDKEYPIDEIRRPLSSLPAIVEPGSSFEAEVALDSGAEVVDFYLSTSNSRVEYEYRLEVEGVEVTESGYRLVIRVPDDVFEDLYDLYMRARTGDGAEIWDVQPRAVSVADVDGDFTFIHLTDMHVGDWLRTIIDGQFSLVENLVMGWKLAYEVVEEVNLIHPDFVVITGDIVYGGNYEIEYDAFYQILQRFDVPTFVLPGNHDTIDLLLPIPPIPGPIRQDGRDYYLRYIGPLYYSFDYGKAHFTMADSSDCTDLLRTGIFGTSITGMSGCMSEEQLRWIGSDLMCGSELKFLCFHHPIDQLSTGKELVEILDTRGVDFVLNGHEHDDYVYQHGGTTVVRTTSCGGDTRGGYWGYRLFEVKGWEVTSYGSIPLFELDVEYSGP
jgi:hypothetical protein